MLYPLKFIPVYKDYIWGGRNFKKLGKILPEGNIAEAWEVSCHPDGICTILNGIYQGISLKELIEKNPLEVVGSDVYKNYKTYFPLLFKLIDANENLSVQVHPDDEYARKHENNSFGKHEVWYIIDAKPNAKIIYGLRKDTDKEDFSRALCENRIESYLNYINVYPGDIIDIHPGIVHAICEGILLAEIQQNSNLTYRVYDYNRVDKNGNKRELHIEEALNVINFDANCQKGKIEGLDVQINLDSTKTNVLTNKHFSLEILNINGSYRENTEKTKFHIYFFIDGEATIEYIEGEIPVKKGETVFIPASLEDYSINGHFKALKTYVPDIQNDTISPLSKKGDILDDIDKIIY